MNMLQRWRAYQRQYGTAGLVKYVALRMIRPLWERTGLLFLVAHSPAERVVAKLPIEIRKLLPEHYGLVPLATEDWFRRWSIGDICYSAWVEDKCVHVSWFSHGSTLIGEVHRMLEVETNQGYIYDCFTEVSHRGRGIYPAVLSSIVADKQARGYSTFWIAVDDKNVSSIKGIERAGFRRAGLVRYLRIGMWTSFEILKDEGTTFPGLSIPV